MHWTCNSMNNLSWYCDLVDAKNEHLTKISLYLKFIYSEKATNLVYVVTVKYMVEILQNFVAFSEYMNFMNLSRFWRLPCLIRHFSSMLTLWQHGNIFGPFWFSINYWFLETSIWVKSLVNYGIWQVMNLNRLLTKEYCDNVIT